MTVSLILVLEENYYFKVTFYLLCLDGLGKHVKELQNFAQIQFRRNAKTIPCHNFSSKLKISMKVTFYCNHMAY